VSSAPEAKTTENRAVVSGVPGAGVSSVQVVPSRGPARTSISRSASSGSRPRHGEAGASRSRQAPAPSAR